MIIGFIHWNTTQYHNATHDSLFPKNIFADHKHLKIRGYLQSSPHTQLIHLSRNSNNYSDIPPSANSSQSTKRFTKTTSALIFPNNFLICYVSIENESDCYWISYSSEPIDLKKSKPFKLYKCLWIGIIGSCSYTLHCVGIWRDIQYVYPGQFANKNLPWCKKIDILISYNDILNH